MAVNGDGSPPGGGGHGPVSRALVVVASSLVLVVGVVAMAGQAVRGNRTVGIQRDAVTVRDAALDNAYYHCLEVQVRSLVRPGEPVVFDGNLGDLVNLIKAAGSWLTIANPYSSAEARLSARNGVTTGGACSSTQVVASVPTAHHGGVVRVGTGDSILGDQPPPAPPL